jgi:hypothetical protein
MGSIAIFGAKSFNEELHADECSIFSFWTFFGVLPKYVRVIFVEFSMPVFMDCFFHALFFFYGQRLWDPFSVYHFSCLVTLNFDCHLRLGRIYQIGL